MNIAKYSFAISKYLRHSPSTILFHTLLHAVVFIKLSFLAFSCTSSFPEFYSLLYPPHSVFDERSMKR